MGGELVRLADRLLVLQKRAAPALTVTYRASTTLYNGGVTTFNAPIPTGTQNGDLLLLWFESPYTNETLTAPSGWTAAISLFSDGVTYTDACYWAVYSGTLALGFAAGHVDSKVVVDAYYNQSASSPIGQVAYSNNASSTSVACGTITPVSTNNMLVAALGMGYSDTVTDPAGYTTGGTLANTYGTAQSAYEQVPNLSAQSPSFTLSTAHVSGGMLVEIAHG